jgi:hypothetical protein
MAFAQRLTVWRSLFWLLCADRPNEYLLSAETIA